MIDWLCRAFGFSVHLLVADNDTSPVQHAELKYGDALLMVGQADGDQIERFDLRRASPLDVGGANTQTLQIYVDDVDVHHAAAVAAGATIVQEPFVADHGEDYWADKCYGAVDPEGHLWWIAERLRG